MGEFRERMIRDLEIHGKAEKTQQAYVAAMAGLVRYWMRPPDQLGPEEIKRYQHHLIRERELSYSTVNVAVCAFRFFYEHTVPADWDVERIPFHKKPRKLPVILSRQEVARVLEAAEPVPWRTMFMTMYGTGFRLSDCRRLRVGDVNSERMVLEVRRGKGAKDRYVPLSRSLLEELRRYWRVARPSGYLFPGAVAGRPWSATTVQRRFQKAVRRADIKKRVVPHSLRHAFATHMLENGTHIRALQRILGHASLRTTSIYLHCSEEYLQGVTQPLDRLVEVLRAGGG